MAKNILPDSYNPVPPILLNDLRNIINSARSQDASTENKDLIMMYWNIGSYLNHYLLKTINANFKGEILVKLARNLRDEYQSADFQTDNIRSMMSFARIFQDEQMLSKLSVKLPWSHFKLLISMKKVQRNFYIEKVMKEDWTASEIDCHIKLYEKTLYENYKKELIIKRETAKEEKREKTKRIRSEVSKWTKSLEATSLFVKDNKSRKSLSLLSIDDLKRKVKTANALLQTLLPLRSAQNDIYITSKYPDLIYNYTIVYKELQNIIALCNGNIERKSISARERAIEKKHNNKKEDIFFFQKMHRLVEGKIKAMDKWYENESRHFYMNKHENVMEYLSAYGRTIRNNALTAKIQFVGKEDTDEWGYFSLSDSFLPFCLREIKVINNTTEYHLYTFNKVTSMDSYDYDDAITERVLYLYEKGIK